MNVNLPMKKENSFIDKMKKFFKKLFNKEGNNVGQTSNLIEDEEKVEDNTKSNFQDSIKLEVKSEYEYLNNLTREEFLKELESNPSLLYELPIEKLEKLEKYYDESIAKYGDKLSKLKKVG